jgi:hypothetical protein
VNVRRPVRVRSAASYSTVCTSVQVWVWVWGLDIQVQKDIYSTVDCQLVLVIIDYWAVIIIIMHSRRLGHYKRPKSFLNQELSRAVFNVVHMVRTNIYGGVLWNDASHFLAGHFCDDLDFQRKFRIIARVSTHRCRRGNTTCKN